MRADLWRTLSRPLLGLTAGRPALRKDRRLARAEESFALTTHGFAELLCRTEATQRLQSCDCLQRRCMAANAGRQPDFSVLRNSELGGASCGVAARYRISYRIHSGLGVRTNAGRNQAHGRARPNATTAIQESRLDLCCHYRRSDLDRFVLSRALHGIV